MRCWRGLIKIWSLLRNRRYLYRVGFRFFVPFGQRADRGYFTRRLYGDISHFDPDQRAEAAQAMLLLAVMVGSIQILIAVFRLGDLTRYISESVILGFMTAASIQLGIGQISNALGVRNIGTGYQHLLYRLWLTLTEGDPINLKAVAIAAVTLVLALYLRRVVRRHKLPQFDMIASLVLVAFGAFLLGWTVPGADGKAALRVAGEVPNSLPSPSIPDINLNWIRSFYLTLSRSLSLAC